MQKEGKVGKKGQVVIPNSMRTALKMEAGSKVTFTLENNRIIIKPFFDAVAVFKRIAQEINYNKEIDLTKT